jgi:sugar transferase EpsL
MGGHGRSPEVDPLTGHQLFENAQVLLGTQKLIKRAFDVAAAAAGLVVAAPALAVTATALRFSVGSPVLFRHQRPGLGGRPFTLYKFRTMTEAKGADGELLSDAQRLTTVGRVVRSLSLDELPQLWNVLKGDMSLIGPRPLLMQYLGRYSPEQARRHEVKPGITGWAQVHGRNTVDWERKFELDVWYVDHFSLALDARILAMTALSVVKREGISSVGHATMSEFMGSQKAA